METRFTRGPWSFCGCGKCGMVFGCDQHIADVTMGPWGDTWPAIRVEPGIGGKAEAFLDRMDYGNVPPEIGAANARLIAAAPEMYELLEQLIPGPGQNMNDVNKHTLRDLWEELRARINA